MADQLPTYPITDRTCPYDPPAGLLALQEQAPLVRVQLPTGPAWLVTSYDAARALLDDPRMSSDMGREGFPTLYRQKMRPVLKGSFMRMDGDQHAFYRTMLAGEFSVKRVQAMRPEIEQACDQLLDEMIRQGPPANLHQSYGVPVSSRSICQLLGVPYDDAGFFTTHLEALFDPHRAGAPERIAESRAALSGYLDELVSRKEKDPGDDMISRLVADYLIPGKVDRPELLLTSYLLLAAGHETTASMITTGTAALLMHPEQLVAVRDEPHLLRGAVEELLRYLSIFQFGITRVATEDVKVGDQTVAAGEGIVVSPLLGNRDQGVYDDPHTLDVRRRGRPHLSFGHGPHLCVGHTLARIELQIAFARLLMRLPDLRLDVPESEVPFRTETLVFGTIDLPVTWGEQPAETPV
ncbi:cytochrome P450 [Streptomyces sp. NBRC 110035]|uniref:cytochrome P450 n=1 Tax=Streptomyces sp. NBRC 110035 TaxID=1547867 RepID=UPI0005A80318|nr:cytochrome P450 [Streptomyces sp. NBRC 110035]